MKIVIYFHFYVKINMSARSSAGQAIHGFSCVAKGRTSSTLLDQLAADPQIVALMEHYKLCVPLLRGEHIYT